MKTFNIEEAAEFLGAHKETVRRLAVIGQIPGVKIGRSWRFIETRSGGLHAIQVFSHCYIARRCFK